MRLEDFEKNPVLNLSLNFALLVIDYCEKLCAEKKFVIAQQLLKSGTSIGANVMEAQNAESKADFIHKMKLASKEAGETQYWLLLCENSHYYPSALTLLEKLEEVNRIITRIISTSKRKQHSRRL
jgi:four helix bundle protein